MILVVYLWILGSFQIYTHTNYYYLLYSFHPPVVPNPPLGRATGPQKRRGIILPRLSDRQTCLAVWCQTWLAGKYLLNEQLQGLVNVLFGDFEHHFQISKDYIPHIWVMFN